MADKCQCYCGKVTELLQQTVQTANSHSCRARDRKQYNGSLWYPPSSVNMEVAEVSLTEGGVAGLVTSFSEDRNRRSESSHLWWKPGATLVHPNIKHLLLVIYTRVCVKWYVYISRIWTYVHTHFFSYWLYYYIYCIKLSKYLNSLALPLCKMGIITVIILKGCWEALRIWHTIKTQ